MIDDEDEGENVWLRVDQKPKVVESILDNKISIIDELIEKSTKVEKEKAPSTSLNANKTMLKEKEPVRKTLQAFKPIPRPASLFLQRFIKQQKVSQLKFL